MTRDPEEHTLHSPEPSLGGADVDEAVQNAESGSLTEGVHRPPAPDQEVGESRLEQMREVGPSGDAGQPDA